MWTQITLSPGEFTRSRSTLLSTERRKFWFVESLLVCLVVFGSYRFLLALSSDMFMEKTAHCFPSPFGEETVDAQTIEPPLLISTIGKSIRYVTVSFCHSLCERIRPSARSSLMASGKDKTTSTLPMNRVELRIADMFLSKVFFFFCSKVKSSKPWVAARETKQVNQNKAITKSNTIDGDRAL